MMPIWRRLAIKQRRGRSDRGGYSDRVPIDHLPAPWCVHCRGYGGYAVEIGEISARSGARAGRCWGRRFRLHASFAGFQTGGEKARCHLRRKPDHTKGRCPNINDFLTRDGPYPVRETQRGGPPRSDAATAGVFPPTAPAPAALNRGGRRGLFFGPGLFHAAAAMRAHAFLSAVCGSSCTVEMDILELGSRSGHRGEGFELTEWRP